jgi:hypothetical protein
MLLTSIHHIILWTKNSKYYVRSLFYFIFMQRAREIHEKTNKQCLFQANYIIMLSVSKYKQQQMTR